MADLPQIDRFVLSYCSRGVSKDQAAEKIAEFFGIKSIEAAESIKRLRTAGLVIESKSVAGVTVYTTSPLKVKSAMLDQSVLAQLIERERGTKAGSLKHKQFTVHPETGEVMSREKVAAQQAKETKRRGPDLGFEIS